MPKLLINGEWYESVASDSIYEPEFESLLMANSKFLYPDFYLVKFKMNAQSPDGTGRPDLALIDKGYRSWWVVEVELGHHPLESHVRQQVRIFARAHYGAKHAEYLAQKDAELDQGKLKEMMLGLQPRVLVLVNVPRPSWQHPLATYDALLGVVEIFRSARNHHVLRINGEQPEPLSDELSLCSVDSAIRRSLIVESPAALPSGDRFQIAFDDQVSTWTILRTRDRIWLHPTGRYPLPTNEKRFVLRRRSDGSLSLGSLKTRVP